LLARYTEQGVYDENFAEYEESSCCICLEDFKTAVQGTIGITKVKRCGHMFHTACIKSWLTSSKTILTKDPRCPLCNLSIKEAG
jgi:hypothetical protein